MASFIKRIGSLLNKSHSIVGQIEHDSCRDATACRPVTSPPRKRLSSADDRRIEPDIDSSKFLISHQKQIIHEARSQSDVVGYAIGSAAHQFTVLTISHVCAVTIDPTTVTGQALCAPSKGLVARDSVGLDG
jgi:hypothetical protein